MKHLLLLFLCILNCITSSIHAEFTRKPKTLTDKKSSAQHHSTNARARTARIIEAAKRERDNRELKGLQNTHIRGRTQSFWQWFQEKKYNTEKADAIKANPIVSRRNHPAGY